MRRFLWAAVLLALSAPVMAQQLWQSASSGMSPAQVRGAYPGVLPVEKPSPLKGGALDLLELRNVEIIGRPFRVRFFFLNDGLTQVTLSADVTGTVTESVQSFEALIGALRSKYGSELSRRVKRDALGATGDASWVSGTTSVDASAFIYDASGTFMIVYRNRADAGAKL